MKRYYPMFTDVEGRTCVVVGGGPVAQERARRLVEHGARVRLVAPDATPTLESMVAHAEITEFRQREYRASDLEGCTLAIAATNSRDVNRAVGRDARERGVPCNVADDPSRGDFIVPALVRRGDLAFAVTTGGAAPAVSAHVRARLEDVFGPEWEALLDILGRLRDETRALHPDPSVRASRIRAVLGSDVLELLARGRSGEAEDRVRGMLGMDEGG